MALDKRPADAVPLAERLTGLIARIESGLLERETAARLALLAALAGEHVLLIGPPGTAKSELARRLQAVFAGATYFERLLTRFTTPEELFGPLSLSALESDRYERLVDAYLPTAGIAFLDEVFKANSAILNALLTLLNEREFDNGPTRTAVPLICVVGASNEVPADESLLAFYDRFLLRVPVQPVSDAAFEDLLRMDRPLRCGAVPYVAEGGGVAPVTESERQQLLRGRDTVELGAEAVSQLQALRSFCRQHEVTVSDRRWRQLVGLLKTAACCEGRGSVDAVDLWLAPFVVAHRPAQVVELEAWFVDHVVQAGAGDAPWLTRAVEAFERQLEIESSARDDERSDTDAGKLALARTLGGSSADDEAGLQRITSEKLEDRLRRHYSRVHVAARVAQVEQALERACIARDDHRRHLEQLRDALKNRLWMPPRLAASVIETVRHSVERLDDLVARLAGARSGFASLPVDTDPDEAREPSPIAING